MCDTSNKGGIKYKSIIFKWLIFVYVFTLLFLSTQWMKRCVFARSPINRAQNTMFSKIFKTQYIIYKKVSNMEQILEILFFSFWKGLCT